MTWRIGDECEALLFGQWRRGIVCALPVGQGPMRSRYRVADHEDIDRMTLSTWVEPCDMRPVTPTREERLAKERDKWKARAELAERELSRRAHESDGQRITPEVLDVEDARAKLRSAADARYAKTNEDERYGQALFNAAEEIWPAEARSLAGGRLDPFQARAPFAAACTAFIDEMAKRIAVKHGDAS